MAGSRAQVSHDAFGFSAPSFADRAAIEAAEAPAPGADDEHLGYPLLVFPSLKLPTRVLELNPEYPDISVLREGETRLREALWLGLSNANDATPVCANKTFGPHRSSDPQCVDWCFGEFVQPGTWGLNLCCPSSMCYNGPSLWAPIGYCWTCQNLPHINSPLPSPMEGHAPSLQPSLPPPPKSPPPSPPPRPPPPKPSPPPPYKATIDCVDTAQKLDKKESPCRINGGIGAGSFDKKAPVVMNETCVQLKSELDASRPPSPECCAALVNFIKGGCTCDANLARLAHDFAGTDYDTFKAIGRVAQLQCGYGQVFDPCRNHKGTCLEWSFEPSAGRRPN